MQIDPPDLPPQPAAVTEIGPAERVDGAVLDRVVLAGARFASRDA